MICSWHVVWYPVLISGWIHRLARSKHPVHRVRRHWWTVCLTSPYLTDGGWKAIVKVQDGRWQKSELTRIKIIRISWMLLLSTAFLRRKFYRCSMHATRKDSLKAGWRQSRILLRRLPLIIRWSVSSMIIIASSTRKKPNVSRCCLPMTMPRQKRLQHGRKKWLRNGIQLRLYLVRRQKNL